MSRDAFKLDVVSIRLAVIVTSGSYEEKSWTEESGDILPASRYDEDSMFFDVVFSNKTFDDITEQEKKSSIVHDSSGKWLGQYETEDAAVEMLREMAKDTGGYSDEI